MNTIYKNITLIVVSIILQIVLLSFTSCTTAYQLTGDGYVKSKCKLKKDYTKRNNRRK